MRPETPTVPGASLEAFQRAASVTPLLTPAEEQRLGRRIAQGDESARRHLVQANLRLVMAHARKYRGATVPYADLVQEGVVGLIRATDKFDPERGVHFATYASWSIRQALSEAVRKAASPAYLPARDARRAIQLRREPGSAQQHEVRLLHAVAPATSLETTASEDGAPLRDRLVDPAAQDPYDDVARVDATATVRDRLRRLPQREADVVRMRYALDGGSEKSFAEIGDELGVSAERARQLERRAIERLRADDALAALREAA